MQPLRKHLEGDFNAGEFYYLSIIPQSFKKGFTLTFYKGGTEVSRSVCESFVRVQRYYFATVRDADIPSSISNILDGEPLDAKGTANCYIVREAGSYKLPLVRGNSRTSVGAVDHAGVVWETDNSANAVAKGTSLVTPLWPHTTPMTGYSGPGISGCVISTRIRQHSAIKEHLWI